ncbi:MAG: DUF4185 domain-containing protein [Pseudonocardia sp.]
MSVRVRGVEILGAVTGTYPPNDTAGRWAVHGTDLGILWDDGAGGVLCAFGDTYGVGWCPPGTGPRTADWRFNTLARSTCADLSRGLLLDEMVTDVDGHAAEIVPRTGRRSERTVIPTAGIAVEGRQYLHYMSVRRWFWPGRWRSNHGGIAVSDDGGRTWRRDLAARWPNRPFGRRTMQMGAFARSPRWVWFLHTRNGRRGPVFCARVDPAEVADPAAYRHWTGSSWSPRVGKARPVAAGPAGEISVAFHTGLGCWLLVHLAGGRIVLRTAAHPTGPWTEGETLVDGAHHPGLYGGYLHPWHLDGDTVYLTMSSWGPYAVYLVKVVLDRT